MLFTLIPQMKTSSKRVSIKNGEENENVKHAFLLLFKKHKNFLALMLE